MDRVGGGGGGASWAGRQPSLSASIRKPRGDMGAGQDSRKPGEVAEEEEEKGEGEEGGGAEGSGRRAAP